MDRLRTRAGEVSGDSAYDTRGGRLYLRRRGINANISVIGVGLGLGFRPSSV